MNIFIAIIGYLAGFCGVISFIPQAYKTIKSKNTKEISLITYIIYSIANGLFLLFGFLSIALPIMHSQTSSSTEIIIWGLTLVLPYSVNIASVLTIIFIKLQNMRKFGEKSNVSNIQEKKEELQVNNNVF